MFSPAREEEEEEEEEEGLSMTKGRELSAESVGRSKHLTTRFGIFCSDFNVVLFATMGDIGSRNYIQRHCKTVLKTTTSKTGVHQNIHSSKK